MSSLPSERLWVTQPKPQTLARQTHCRPWKSHRSAAALIIPEKSTAARNARSPSEWYRSRMTAEAGFPIKILRGMCQSGKSWSVDRSYRGRGEPYANETMVYANPSRVPVLSGLQSAFMHETLGLQYEISALF